ncbi:DUF3192 domain-containing protein [Idiomarina seosinensis]|uniref:DUF3192 domain-containing protein n=1 Tax=Idiomarina seosinensis TaxID=281739 RepID=UPI00384E0F19
MTKTGLATALMIGVLSLSGCMVISETGLQHDQAQYDGKQREQQNRNKIAALPMALSAEEVRQRLGTPDFNDRWQGENRNIQVLYYRTHRLHSDGNTTRDECTPLVFINNELVGTGQLALDRVEKSR